MTVEVSLGIGLGPDTSRTRQPERVAGAFGRLFGVMSECEGHGPSAQ